MADNKEVSSTKKSAAAAANKKRTWNDDEVETLIDMYEARPCLWDVADSTYSKKDVKEQALAEIKEEMGIEIPLIKSKWNSLRAQHGRELTKESKTKSGQGTDELYESSWIFMDKMRFIEHVKKTAKSTSTIKITSAFETIEDEEDESEKEEETPVKQSAKETPVNNNKRKRTPNSAEQKQKLISKCIDVLDRPKNPTKEKEPEEPFALYVSDQLKTLDKRRRLLAEKRINDILFEMRFEEFDQPTRFNPGVQNQRFAAPPMQGPYTAMLNNDF